MIKPPNFYAFFGICFCLFTCSIVASGQRNSPNEDLIQRIEATEGMVAFWKFEESAGEPRLAQGKGKFSLVEFPTEVKRMAEGPISGYSSYFDGTNFLSLPSDQTAELNIHGKNQGVTVVAWVKWSGEQTGFVGGMWNEYQEGGKRQYGLFVSLGYYNGADQVCGHVSQSGKATPPFPYSIDYSASKQLVAKNEWSSIAFTYDGEYIKSFVNGDFESRKEELINHTQGFEGYPEGLVQSKNPYYFPDGLGDNGSDFTVGAVLLAKGMGNFFKGQIGGLVVFDRALTDSEVKKLANF
ncbi:LamG-like jellyroll fold domain-containing protein [Algoriphagus sp. C2-6-M1]|uniref:LamG-like jellyroll fold domain-containing protein n=1 Tax=Algoriphagus persicinus TaxID=3108754 RepID=UPI002B38E4DC|nr:LamG-like jellyroll fold domain-containing protein [Algoriphagus sp. C2-6-M1]MEB2779282.1 LamG-like jellyroll fold domain-containing protein [Algoriphagus sp. C2-6-M1]